MMRNQAQAEDLTQDALLRIWKALPSYDGRASVSTWVYAITRNAGFTELKRRAARSALPLDAESLDPAVGQDPALQSLAPTAGAALDVRSCLERLPEPQQRALILFYLEQKSYAETAAALGVPIGTVKTLLYRAKARLASLRFARELNDDLNP